MNFPQSGEELTIAGANVATLRRMLTSSFWTGSSAGSHCVGADADVVLEPIQKR